MKHLSFSCDSKVRGLVGKLIYRSQEYSIDFIDYARKNIENRIGELGVCSLSIGTLQIEVGIETGQLLYPWGLCPLINVEYKHMPMKPSEIAGVYIDKKSWAPIAGAAIEMPNSSSWQTIKDSDSGWFCIGSYDMGCDTRLIELCQDVMISIEKNAVTALWLHPEMTD